MMRSFLMISVAFVSLLFVVAPSQAGCIGEAFLSGGFSVGAHPVGGFLCGIGKHVFRQRVTGYSYSYSYKYRARGCAILPLEQLPVPQVFAAPQCPSK